MWRLKTGDGMLRSKSTQITMQNTWRLFCGMFYQETGTKIPQRTIKDIMELVVGFFYKQRLIIFSTLKQN